ncbi:MAG: retropepsin-like aspartic protease [Leptolyngbyaceae cyanobacterium bins.349]|nr:retropepsin-like aspartic protease [Leptolyngbyaceae cyanobacterium bins.349]
MKGFKRLFAIAGMVSIAISALSVVGDSVPVTAQDDSCYMITSSGKRVSLGKLCRGSAPPPTVTRGFFQARIKRRDGGTPVIDVMFNGRRSYEMLVDTGASRTLVTRSIAQALNIPIVGAGRFIMADGRTIEMPVGRLSSLSVDGATIRDVNVAIAGDYAEGLLGSDFLGNYDVKIKRDVIEFHPR